MAETEKVIAPAEQEGPTELETPVIETPRDPYEKNVLNSITKFFRSRAKNPANFTFDADGNLDDINVIADSDRNGGYGGVEVAATEGARFAGARDGRAREDVSGRDCA